MTWTLYLVPAALIVGMAIGFVDGRRRGVIFAARQTARRFDDLREGRPVGEGTRRLAAYAARAHAAAVMRDREAGRAHPEVCAGGRS
ncbi:MAG: hypothetical protein AAF192_01250 [Pseudomonadota bacterium]